MKLKLALAAMVVCLLLSGISQALLPDFSKEDLIRNADAIVLGTVRDMSCAWSPDRSQIFTYVTFKVESQFKGQPVGQEMVLQIPGGQVGATYLRVSDTPHLEVGMRVILHTFMKETGYPWIYGWEKGVLTVQNNAIPEYSLTVDQFRQLIQSVK